MQAHRYDGMLVMIKTGKLQPEKPIGRHISLEEPIDVLTGMDKFTETGVTVITSF